MLWGRGPENGESLEQLAGRIRNWTAALNPSFWYLNFEKPMEGYNVALPMQATKPLPTKISFNRVEAFDFRRYSLRGAAVHGQAYDGDGNSVAGPYPKDLIAETFMPTKAIAGGGGPAWWYRVYDRPAKTYRWVQVIGHDSSTNVIELRTASGVFFYTDGFFDGSVLRFNQERYLRKTQQGTQIGAVLGFATYAKLGYALGVTRPISPEMLAALAGEARYPGRALVKNVDIWTLEECSDEQFRAVASVA